MTTREDLEAALVVIDEYGWGKNAYVNTNTGNVCALGAVACAVSGVMPNHLDPDGVIFDHLNRVQHHRYDQCAHALEDAIEEETGFRPLVPVWNDHLARDADEVRGIFKRAIDAA